VIPEGTRLASRLMLSLIAGLVLAIQPSLRP
jgi:hypothetical protein